MYQERTFLHPSGSNIYSTICALAFTKGFEWISICNLKTSCKMPRSSSHLQTPKSLDYRVTRNPCTKLSRYYIHYILETLSNYCSYLRGMHIRQLSLSTDSKIDLPWASDFKVSIAKAVRQELVSTRFFKCLGLLQIVLRSICCAGASYMLMDLGGG